MANELPTTGKPRVFSSGFKRDSGEGKTRWSLLPPNIWQSNQSWNKPVADKIVDFLLFGEKASLVEALAIMTAEHGLLPLSERFARGAEVYGLFNWALGAPISTFIDSLGRHMWAQTHPDPTVKKEDHIGAIQWNLAACIHMLDMVECGEFNELEIIDLPPYTKISEFHAKRSVKAVEK
jgi:hypothetical protein